MTSEGAACTDLLIALMHYFIDGETNNIPGNFEDYIFYIIIFLTFLKSPCVYWQTSYSTYLI